MSIGTFSFPSLVFQVENNVLELAADVLYLVFRLPLDRRELEDIVFYLEDK